MMFRIGEVSRILGKSAPWIRLKERQGAFVRADGSKIEPDRTEGNIRQYSLDNLDEMAEALHRRGDFSALEAGRVKTLVAVYRSEEGSEG